MNRILFLLLFTVWLTPAHSDSLPKNYFTPPVDIPMFLAGNFGEIRSNHFHAGIDIKTQGRIGIPIKTCNEGFVSRIKISLRGYGKVLYVDHPNGYTTVYAHLHRFSDKIEAYVKQKQYEQQNFEIELFPKPGELSVEAGESIALSGNTGGSTAPHLHFEIRETLSEKPVNPLLFNFPIKDNIPPEIRRLAIYPLNSVSAVNGKTETLYLRVRKQGDTYHPIHNGLITVNGKIGFGVETIDRLNGVPNRNGIYEIKLLKDNKLAYRYEMRSFHFDETRYIHSHVDYRYWKQRGPRVQRCYLEPANQLSTYSDLVNNGQLFFLDSNNHKMRIEVSDTYGNQSNLAFELRSGVSGSEVRKLEIKGQLVSNGQSAIIEGEGLKLELPENALYSPAEFSIHSEQAIGRAVSPIYELKDRYVPLHDYAKLSIQIPNYQPKYQRNYFLAELDARKVFQGGITGEVKGDSLVTEIRDLGYYTIMIDSVAPWIKALNFGNGTNLNSLKASILKTGDALNDIKKFDAYVDGEWVLMEFDKKSGRLSIDKNELYRFPVGQHLLVVEISDACGNQARKEYNILL